MERNLVAAGVVALLIAAVAIGATVWLQSAEGPGDGGSVLTATEPSVGAAGGAAGTTTEPPPFEMTVESVEPCGQTCRDVTATLENTQDQRATDVTVYTTIYAGDEAEGDPVWEGVTQVGTLEPGASDTETQRIELGFVGAASVQANDGRVTIELVVESDRQRVRFVRHRDVS